MNDEVIVLSPEDSALDAFCLCHGTRLMTLQQAIEKMGSSKAGKRELERRLNRLRKAFNAKNLDAAEGWLYATLDGIKAVDTWIPKTNSKMASEKALKDAQPSGTKALQKKSKQRLNQLRQDINAYIALDPQSALKRGATVCRNKLRSSGCMHEYSDSYVLQKVKEEFAKHRLQEKSKKLS